MSAKVDLEQLAHDQSKLYVVMWSNVTSHECAELEYASAASFPWQVTQSKLILLWNLDHQCMYYRNIRYIIESFPKTFLSQIEWAFDCKWWWQGYCLLRGQSGGKLAACHCGQYLPQACAKHASRPGRTMATSGAWQSVSTRGLVEMTCCSTNRKCVVFHLL